MTNKFILAAAGGVSPVTTNLEFHYDYGDVNCWNRTSQALNDLTGNYSYNPYGLEQNVSNYSYNSSLGGYIETTDTTSYAYLQATTNSPSITSNINTTAFTFEWVHNSILDPVSEGLFWLRFWAYGGSTYRFGIKAVQFNNYGNTYHLATLNFDDTGTYLSQGTTYNTVYSSGSTPAVAYSTLNSNYQTITGWEHLAITRDSFTSSTTNNLKLYRNGVLIKTFTNRNNFDVPMDGSFWAGRTLRIGTYGKNGLFKIYNKALSAAEVTQNYNAYKARFGLP